MIKGLLVVEGSPKGLSVVVVILGAAASSEEDVVLSNDGDDVLSTDGLVEEDEEDEAKSSIADPFTETVVLRPFSFCCCLLAC